jgi:hypothetical protein
VAATAGGGGLPTAIPGSGGALGRKSKIPDAPPMPDTPEAADLLARIADGSYAGPVIEAASAFPAMPDAAAAPAFKAQAPSADGKMRSAIPMPPPLPGQTAEQAAAAAGLGAGQSRRGSAPAVLGGPHMVKKQVAFAKLTKTSSQPELRPLYWTMIDAPKVQGTIWSQLPDKAPVSGTVMERHISDLAARFAKKPAAAAPAGKQAAAAAGGPVQAARPKLLEPNRQQNVGIGLQGPGFKALAAPQLRKAVIELDRDLLQMDNALKLLGMIPTPEEIKLIEDLRADRLLDATFFASMSKEESFVIEMSSVPRLRQRLQCVHIEQSFSKQAEQLAESIADYERAVKCVADSTRWRAFLHLCLETGNYVNEGSKRAGAWGFTMDSLVKLGEARASDSKFSLMHWIAEVAASTKPELLELREEFAPVAAASNSSIEEIKADMVQLRKMVDMVKREVDEARSNEKAEGALAFAKRMGGPFLDRHGLPTVERLGEQVAKLERDAEALVTLHGERTQTMPCQKFFAAVVQGVELMIHCHEENEIAKVMQQKASAAAAAKASGGAAPLANALAGPAKTLERQVTKDQLSKQLKEQAKKHELEAAMAKRRNGGGA